MRKARLRPRRRGASDPNPRWAGGRLTSTGAWDTPAPLPTDESSSLQLAQHFLRGRGVGIERLPTPRHQSPPGQRRHGPRVLPGEQVEERLRPDDETEIAARAERLERVSTV